MLSNDPVHYLVNGSSPEVLTLQIGNYPDGMPLVNHHLGYSAVSRICVRPRNMQELTATLFWVDALIERRRVVPELVLPMLPGARQDRLNPDGDYLFTAKSIAKMINARNFPRVITMDPHSEVMPALIERCEAVHAADVLGGLALGEYAGVIAPDAGAAKRAFGVAQLLGVPCYQAWKKRDTADGSIAGFGMEPFTALSGDAFLVVDDICDGGGTFMGLAELLPDAAQVDLFVTHGIFSKGLDELRKYYREIMTTDSLPHLQYTDSTGATTFAVCETLLRKGKL